MEDSTTFGIGTSRGRSEARETPLICAPLGIHNNTGRHPCLEEEERSIRNELRASDSGNCLQIEVTAGAARLCSPWTVIDSHAAAPCHSFWYSENVNFDKILLKGKSTCPDLSCGLQRTTTSSFIRNASYAIGRLSDPRFVPDL